MNQNQQFEAFYQANKQRIHYQIHRLNIPSTLYDEFYTEGIVALWKAFQDFDDIKGNVGTFLNYRIRFRLIDHIRKRNSEDDLKKHVIQHGMTALTNGTRNRHTDTQLISPVSLPISDTPFWKKLQQQLTANQWKWVHYFVIADLTVREIMEIEDVSADAVKGWGRQVRQKLRNDSFRQMLKERIQS